MKIISNQVIFNFLLNWRRMLFCFIGLFTSSLYANEIYHEKSAIAIVDAVEDNFTGTPINGFVGGTTASVFSNDTLDGSPFANSDVTATLIDNDGIVGLVINADGTLTIPSASMAGAYAIKYQICEAVNPLSCDITVATVLITPPVINAVDDDFSSSPVNGYDGGVTTTVLNNDTLNGAPFANSSVVTSIVFEGGLTNVSIDADGLITIPANTEIGTYLVEYGICEVLNPINCDTGFATIVVEAPAIIALADDFTSTPFNGFDGGTTTSVYSNDSLNGAPLALGEVIATIIDDDGLPGVSINLDGTLQIPSPTPAGSYLVEYQICEIVNPSNCASALASIEVFPPPIEAVTDDYTGTPINGLFGGSFENILDNDLLNGNVINPAWILLTPSTIGGISINLDGTVDILPGIAPGTYTLQYILCDRLNPSNCDVGEVIILVGACLIFPTNDCDGDGVINGDEELDGTNPADPCDLIRDSQSVPISDEFRLLDCDGDGVINQDEWVHMQAPCIFALENQTVTPSEEWNNLDCDGDGVINGSELIDNTHPRSVCEYLVESQTLPPSEEWEERDCDFDGVKNGIEAIDGTNTLDFCDFVFENQTGNYSNEWADFDCDGDGMKNRRERFNNTNPLDPCDFVLELVTLPPSIEWNNLDCDGDGVRNEQELFDETDLEEICEFVLANQTLPPSETWENLDCDEDSVINIDELIDETDPLNICSFTLDSQTLPLTESWLASDCDEDGLSNLDEQADNNDNNIVDFLEANNGNDEAEDNLEAFDFLSPNENGLNDVFVIRGIHQYPENDLKIFNRWGVLVYETTGYGQNGNYFRGISSGRQTIEPNAQLPVGSYYYILTYKNGEAILKQKSGPLYINRK